MLDCIHCGNNNIDSATYCGSCGQVLVYRHVGEKCLTPPPEVNPVTVRSQAQLESFAMGDARTRRFLKTLSFLSFIPLAVLAAIWVTSSYYPPAAAIRPVLLPCLAGLAAIYGILVYSYMIAKTAEAGGTPAQASFGGGCFPPLTPALWARLGNRSLVVPYFYLMVDTIVLGCGGYLAREWPFMLLLLLLVMVPLTIYHLFGCSLRPVAETLGLSPVFTIFWLCLMPDLLLLLLVFDMLNAMNPESTRLVLALKLDEFAAYLSPEHLARYINFKTGLIMYVCATSAGWIKAVYDNLRIPQEQSE